MRILRIFDDGYTKTSVNEWIDAQDTVDLEKKVGKRVQYDGRIWTWQFYQPSNDPGIDTELYYSPASPYEIDLGADEEISPFHTSHKMHVIGSKCECGAEKTDQPGHAHWCPKNSDFVW